MRLRITTKEKVHFLGACPWVIVQLLDLWQWRDQIPAKRRHMATAQCRDRGMGTVDPQHPVVPSQLVQLVQHYEMHLEQHPDSFLLLVYSAQEQGLE